MLCAPTDNGSASELVDNVACPKALSVAVVSVTPASRKATVPLTRPVPGAAANTVAVNVTVWPDTDGFADDTKATAVSATDTVNGAAVENAGSVELYVLSPEYEAVMLWLLRPGANVAVLMLATPAVSGAVPSVDTTELN